MIKRLTLRKRLKKELAYHENLVITKRQQQEHIRKNFQPGKERIDKVVRLDIDISHINEIIKVLKSLL